MAHRGSRGIALPFHDHGTKGVEGSASRPGRSLPPGKTRYPLYRRLGGAQGRSGKVRKISPPPGFDPLWGSNMQQTVVILLKTSWAPSNSLSFYTSHIIALDLFCCHCRRHSYLSGIGLLQLCRVIQRSVNKADHCRCLLQWSEKNQTRGGSHQCNSDCWHQTQNKKMFSSFRVAITNTSKRNHPPNCPVIWVLLVARERAQCINVPDVMWACMWCLV